MNFDPEKERQLDVVVFELAANRLRTIDDGISKLDESLNAMRIEHQPPDVSREATIHAGLAWVASTNARGVDSDVQKAA